MILVHLSLICYLLIKQVSKRSARIKELEDELSIARNKCQETQKEVSRHS